MTKQALAGALLGLVLPLPLVLSLLLLAPGFVDGTAFAALLAHPQFWGALQLSFFSGVTSTVLALVLALVVVAQVAGNPAPRAGLFLAVPHLAFAIGLSFLVMPSGLLARIIAAVFTGWAAPPAWVTTQDPLALALAVALVLKEVPFLVWAFASVMNRDDMRVALSGQRDVALSLGHTPASVFLRVVAPQILSRAIWPCVAVLAYATTVVDMALVIGPTQPPTLAQLAWTDLNDGDPAANARGAAGVLALSFLILILLLVVGLFLRLGRSQIGRFYSQYSPSRQPRKSFLGQIWGVWGLIYGAVAVVLLIQSFGGLWPFPQLLPEAFQAGHWLHLIRDGAPALNSLWLALACATLGLCAAVMWLEGLPARADRWIVPVAVLMLCLPALVLGLGQYRLFLLVGITGTAPAMLLAHVMPVAAYVFILLLGPYRGFDRRWQDMSAGLGKTHMEFLMHVKWPLLKAPLLAAFAVGFAVSIAQYVPAQLASAGRWTTLPMEAVALSSGGNRGLLAAYGLALAAMPLAIFLLAGFASRSRWGLS